MEAVGDGVSRVRPGDRVVLALAHHCGHCPYCETGRPMLCPARTVARDRLFRDGAPCDECVGRFPLPSVRHGCYRGSAVATVPVTTSFVANRRRWWSSVSRFFCISATQRETLIAAGMPESLLSVKYNFVPDAGVHRTGPGRHFLYLGRLMIHPDGFSSDPNFQVGGQNLIDTRRLFYDGNSQGGIIGGALTAVAVDHDRAVLGVPGMNYSTLLSRSTDWGTGQQPSELDLPEYSWFMYEAYPNELQRQLIF